MLVRILRRLPWAAVLLAFYAYELVAANLRVAWDVLTPRLRSAPAIVRVPTRCLTDWELTHLSNIITMTPGTLTLEIDTDTNDIFVHTLFGTDREAFLRNIERLETLLLKAMR